MPRAGEVATEAFRAAGGVCCRVVRCCQGRGRALKDAECHRYFVREISAYGFEYANESYIESCV